MRGENRHQVLIAPTYEAVLPSWAHSIRNISLITMNGLHTNVAEVWKQAQKRAEDYKPRIGPIRPSGFELVSEPRQAQQAAGPFTIFRIIGQHFGHHFGQDFD